MDPDTDVCQTEQPQISYSVDFIAEQSRLRLSAIIILLLDPGSQNLHYYYYITYYTSIGYWARSQESRRVPVGASLK